MKKLVLVLGLSGLVLMGCESEEVKKEAQEVKNSLENIENDVSSIEEMLKESEAEKERADKAMDMSKGATVYEIESPFSADDLSEKNRELFEKIQKDMEQYK